MPPPPPQGDPPGIGHSTSGSTPTVITGLLGTNGGPPQDPPAAGGTTTAKAAGPTPPVNPPGTGSPALPQANVCQGGINAAPSSGYAGAKGLITIVIVKPGDVTKVMVRSTRVVAEVKKTGDGTWEQPFIFQGREGVIPITLDAYDASGKVVCANTINVTSKGVKQP